MNVSDVPDVIVAGHICLDIIPALVASTPEQFRQSFGPGRLTEAGPASLSTGGAVSNVGLALHKLGARTQLMGKVGDDLFGGAIVGLVRSVDPRLAEGMVVDKAANSSYSVVINPPGIDRMFIHSPGANDTFGAGDVRYDLLQTARIFHFGYPPIMARMYADGGRELVEVMRRARATGITTSLDMAMPDPAAPSGRADWATILTAALSNVDIFMPSVEEILLMLRRDTFLSLEATGGVLAQITPDLLSSLSAQLLAMGAAVVGLKLGNRGLYLRTADEARLAATGRGRPADPARWADRELWSPCFRVHAAGTTGSGDSTIAGFLVALLRGLTPAEAATMAVAVGACNVEASDALSGLRTWDETAQRVAAGWQRHDLALDAPGWTHDPSRGMWFGPGIQNAPAA